MYCNVIVTSPLDQLFTYKVRNKQLVQVGSIVLVPFGKKKIT